jgi:hypothetical protein
LFCFLKDHFKFKNNLLKLREQALIEKSNAELSWLEQMKKKCLSKGIEDEKMPMILKKEKLIIDQLKLDQVNKKFMCIHLQPRSTTTLSFKFSLLGPT